MTPSSAILDSRIKGVLAVTRPYANEAPVVFVGNGSRTVKQSQSASHGKSVFMFSALMPEESLVRTAWADCVIAAAPVSTLLNQPVEPRPVDTITPLEDCVSVFSP